MGTPNIYTVLSMLALVPRAENLIVFGSAARGVDSPTNVELVLDLRPLTLAEFARGGGTGDQQDCSARLLHLARTYLGWVDPVLRLEDAMLIRSEYARDWFQALNAAELMAAIDSDSVPLAQVLKRYLRPDALPEAFGGTYKGGNYQR